LAITQNVFDQIVADLEDLAVTPEEFIVLSRGVDRADEFAVSRGLR
jgi:hypothetical protein